MRSLFFGGLSLLVSAPAAWAACGLDHCPPSAAPGVDEPADVRVLQRVSFLGEAWSQAVTSETTIGASGRLAQGVLVGLGVPLIGFVRASDRAIGLGDTLVWADVARTRGSWRAAGGLQLELPTAAHPAFADGHFLALPYARARYQAGRFDFAGRVGFSQVLGRPPRSYDNPLGGHVHDTSPITPHADSEALFRAEAGATFYGPTTLRVAARADVTREVVKDGQTLGTAGPVFELSRGRFLGQVFAEAPFTLARHAELRVATQISVGWGRAASRRAPVPPLETP